MARYTSLFVTPASTDDLHGFFTHVFEAFQLNMVHRDAGYWVAKEGLQQASLSQISTVEVMLDSPLSQAAVQEFRLTLVVHNEELPLKRNNHCKQVFDQIYQALMQAPYFDRLGDAVALS